MANNKLNTGLIPLSIRELKKKCIMLGIPFENLSEGVPELNSWLDKLSNNKEDESRLKEYDDWIAKVIKSGTHAVDAGSLLHKDMCYYQEVLESDEVKEKKPKTEKREKKPKAEKDKFGFRRGTKKSKVAELVDKGCSAKLIRKKMIKEFGEVNEQSLKIWIRKSQSMIYEKK